MTWRQKAACRGTDPSVFFPANEADAGIALAICAECPVIGECRDAYLFEEYGVWAGLTEQQRRQIRRHTPRPAPTLEQRIEHGTPNGYRHHFRLGIPMCAPCHTANLNYRADLKERQTA